MSSYRFNFTGGIERASYELARRLVAAGDEVTLVSYDVDPRPEPPLAWQQVRLAPHIPATVPVQFSAAASGQVDRNSFDLLHNQGGTALRGQDVITAHSCHRAWWEMKKRSGELTRAYLNPLHHTVLHIESLNYRPGAYAQVIAVSHGVKREIIKYYGVPAERISVIPNGVDLSRFTRGTAATRAELRRQNGYGEDEVVLLFVGKEFRRKGLLPAIQSLSGLPSTARLLVVGGDDRRPFEQAAAQAGVADRIRFVGHTDRVADYFSCADVFVFPTAYEAFALVSLEAAASGLPIVTTRVNGTEDLVIDGRNGCFVERDSSSLTAGLEPLVTDADLRRRMGAAARADAMGYTWEAMAARTREVYREVLDRRRIRDRGVQSRKIQ